VDQRGGALGITLESERPAWGIATSGFGGRSLTRGVASAVTILADTASLADAAATAVANACYIEDRGVIQRPARQFDPETDLSGVSVTSSIGKLSGDKKLQAIERAMMRVHELFEKEIILGAYVAVQGEFAMTDFFKERLMAEC
jgi:ApbE superfamily uncharacterized protein (UPF0280 family)